MDRLTPEQRRKNMQHVKNKDSQIELALRRALWWAGFRYRKNVREIFGCPDIVFKRLKIAVFCDSEFWHGYDWENRNKDFKSHQEFWIPKIERNILRNSGDILQIDEKNIPAFDICLASFPCQAFSIAGKKQGFDDDYYGEYKGTLFREVVRVCDFHKPKLIFCENVKGLVIHDKGRTFKTIYTAFEKLSYNIHYKILNSKNFGLAQNRERIYIVCFRNDIDDTNFKFPAPANKKVTLAEILEDAPVPSKYYFRRRKLWIKNFGHVKKKL